MKTWVLTCMNDDATMMFSVPKVRASTFPQLVIFTEVAMEMHRQDKITNTANFMLNFFSTFFPFGMSKYSRRLIWNWFAVGREALFICSNRPTGALIFAIECCSDMNLLPINFFVNHFESQCDHRNEHCACTKTRLFSCWITLLILSMAIRMDS